MTEYGRLRRIASKYLDPAARNILQHPLEPVHVHRLVEGIAHRLEHERMVRHLNVAGHGIVLAHDLLGEYCCQQVVGTHSQQCRWRLLAVGEAQNRQRPRGVPPPTDGKQRDLQHRLRKYLLDLGQRHVLEHVLERERQRRAERQVDAVLGGSGLKLEVERPAYLLPQGESPRLVDAGAVGRMHD